MTWDADLEDPTIAVGIPTHNNEETIDRTVDQLLSQTLQPDVVAVCDNSRDRTPEIVAEKASDADVDIELLEQTGDGVAAAYNQLWDHLAPEYDVFATIQTNLVVGEDWLEGHVSTHRNHPGVGIVTALGDDVCREIGPDEQGYYTGRNVSFKSGVLERVDGWDDNFLRGEDWDMQIRFAGAGVRSYRCSRYSYGWLDEYGSDDPYISLAKTKRRPTALTFLKKYGSWYLRYHPSHIVHDLLSVAATVLGALSVLLFPVSTTLAALLAIGCLLSVVAYDAGHVLVRGPVRGSYVFRPIRKQFFNGIGVLYAARRVQRVDDWNMAGFDPAAIPSFELEAFYNR